jgi:hypothetical protein
VLRIDGATRLQPVDQIIEGGEPLLLAAAAQALAGVAEIQAQRASRAAKRFPQGLAAKAIGDGSNA